MPNSKKIVTLLGFAQKAGKLASGDFAVKAAFKDGKAKWLFLAKDAGTNSREELVHLAEVAGIGVEDSLTAAEIGTAIGKDFRISAVLLDKKFLKMLEVENKMGGCKNAETCV